jgi:hypothetical protein
MQQNATRPSKLRECSSANCGDVHPPAFDSDEPKTRLRNEPNLTLYFQQELRTKAKFHPERQADSPAHGCIRVQPDATRAQIVRMLHPLRGGRTPAVEPKIKLRNEANSSFLFNKGSKWKPNSVSARLRRPPPTRHKCNLMQHSQQNRYNPAVATRFTPITVRKSSPAVPIRLARNGADTMKLKDLREIGFVRQKNAEPHCPTAQALDSRQSLQSPSGTHSHPHVWPAPSPASLAQASPSSSTAPHANSFDSNDNGFVRPILHPARIGALDAQLRTNPPNRAQPAPAPRTQHPAPAREARHSHPLAFCRNIRHHRIPHPIPKAGYK